NGERMSLRSVINTGHMRNIGVIRCGDRDTNRAPELFSTFAPKAIGMIGTKLPQPTLTRCIIIKMFPKKETDRVASFLAEDDAGFLDLRSRLRRWSMDNAQLLHDTVRRDGVMMPRGFFNRLADNWRLLFAIADLCGEHWGDDAREAADWLTEVTISIGVQLL